MNDQPYNDLIGDMLKKDNYAYEKDLKGKGKPLKASYLQGDVVQHFQRVAREQGYLPEWLKKQHEIRALLEQVETKQDLQAVNQKIKAYNRMCPLPMQKPTIAFEHLERFRSEW
ncbi:MAG TPA: DnaJ family domain-containing protein [Savagea sp.]